MAGGLYWQLTASVSPDRPQRRRPLDHRAPTSSRPRAGCAPTAAEGVRVEVPPTANHWESAYLAPKFELARGWLRQLDTTRDDIFYDEGELTAATYGAWLRGNAISYVALPDAPLDYSSAAERRLILSDPSYLDLRWRSPHWRIYAVRDPKPLVAPLGAARGADALGRPPGLRPRRHPPGRVPRPRQLHPLLVDLPRRRLHPPPRRLDRRPRLPPRHLPRRRRLLPRPRLERGHRRPQDLLRRTGLANPLGRRDEPTDPVGQIGPSAG